MATNFTALIDPYWPADCPPLGSTVDLFGETILTCTLCEEKRATAHWRGAAVLSLCRGCALTALPRLLADALVGEDDRPTGDLREDLDGFNKEFWKGVLFAKDRVSQARRRGAAHVGERAGGNIPPAVEERAGVRGAPGG